MKIIFITNQQDIAEQDYILLQALQEEALEQNIDFVLCCPTGSLLAMRALTDTIPCRTYSFGVLGALKLLHKLFQKEKTSIHIFDKALYKAVSLFIKSSSHCTLVASHHTRRIPFEKKALQEDKNFALQAFIKGKVSALFVSSLELKEFVLEKSFPKNTIITLPYIVQPLSEKEKEQGTELSLKDTDNTFTFFAETSFLDENSFCLLFSAIAEFKERLMQEGNNTKISLFMTGKIHNCDFMLEKAKEFELEENLAHFGIMDMRFILPLVSAVICASQEYEGECQTIINAWQCSLPVIASDNMVHTDMFLEKPERVSGLLFSGGQKEKLSQALYRVFSEKDFREKIIQNSKQALHFYSVKSLAKSYLEAIEKL